MKQQVQLKTTAAGKIECKVKDKRVESAIKLYRQHEKLLAEVESLKKDIRETAKKTAQEYNGVEHVIFYDGKDEIKVVLVPDSISLKPDVDLVDARRISAVLGKVAKLKEGVKLKPGANLASLKNKLGEDFDRFLVEDVKLEVDAFALDQDENIRTASDLMESLSRKKNTPRVCFSKK